MPEPNGIRATLDYHERELQRLDRVKSSAESMHNIEADVREIRQDVGKLRSAIITACITWAVGSGGFLIGVLLLTRGG